MSACLPQDLSDAIWQSVLDEKHLLARLLLRRASMSHLQALTRDDVADIRSDMDESIRLWRAILSLACYDSNLIIESRKQHDIWYQLTEDPYEMRAGMSELSDRFAAEFAPILEKIAFVVQR